MFWGLAAITAAEYKFPNRPSGDTWLTLAIGVFNDQKSPDGKGWDTTICGGGLRWQKEIWQSGYTMKNAVSNGGFFMLAARLAWYTQDEEYATWAEKVWDWSTSVNLVNNETWAVADSVRQGTGGPNGCTLPDHTRWTYNYGTYLSGAGYMYAYVSIVLLSPIRLLLLTESRYRRTILNGLISQTTYWIHCSLHFSYPNTEVWSPTGGAKLWVNAIKTQTAHFSKALRCRGFQILH
jgi:hypothetical protein